MDGYESNKDGSQLNNFLAENSGKRSIVFLDEVDKTWSEVRNALFVITEKGECTYCQYQRPMDCTKTIWALATNLGDATISNYHRKNPEKLTDGELYNADMKPLQDELKRTYLNTFGAPMTGRINLFTSFLPFARIERAVLVHNYFLKISTEIRKPIEMNAKSKKLVGHCRLRIVDDSTVYCHLADQFYIKDRGARSLNGAVKTVREEFISEYSNTGEFVSEESNKGPLKTYYVRRIPLGNDAYKVRVFAAIDGEEEADE